MKEKSRRLPYNAPVMDYDIKNDVFTKDHWRVSFDEAKKIYESMTGVWSSSGAVAMARKILNLPN